MLAEAIHSLADCTNQIFLLIGIRQAQRAPNAAHPMGYGRVVYFWAMMVATLLFFLGGAFSVLEGVRHVQHPEPISNPLVAMLVLGVSVLLEGFSLDGAMREIRKISNGQSFVKWFQETRQSELMVVAVVVTREVKAMITGESAAPDVNAAIKAHIEVRPEVESVINLITLQWGEQLMIAVQAKMAPQPSDVALIMAINEVEASLQLRWPQAKWCFFEPDFAPGD